MSNLQALSQSGILLVMDALGDLPIKIEEAMIAGTPDQSASRELTGPIVAKWIKDHPEDVELVIMVMAGLIRVHQQNAKVRR